jgi:hypothetical protein
MMKDFALRNVRSFAQLAEGALPQFFPRSFVLVAFSCGCAGMTDNFRAGGPTTLQARPVSYKRLRTVNSGRLLSLLWIVRV